MIRLQKVCHRISLTPLCFLSPPSSSSLLFTPRVFGFSTIRTSRSARVRRLSGNSVTTVMSSRSASRLRCLASVGPAGAEDGGGASSISSISGSAAVADDDGYHGHGLQSDRFFNALKGHGVLCRLVILPYESHGYSARESIMHTLWETDRWLQKYCVPNASDVDTVPVDTKEVSDSTDKKVATATGGGNLELADYMLRR